LTPAGRGAIATCGLHGDVNVLDREPPLFRAANGQPMAAQPIDRICFGHWVGDAPEEVVLCRIDERTTEIHCHGGAAAEQRILNDLRARGCRVETWQESLRSTMGCLDAECTESLTRAPTLRTARVLLEQQQGLLRGTIEKLIDAPADAALAGVADLLHWADFGLHLTRPWRVVLCGRPNVGKSSLINALVGYARSIVFDQPGTTRDVVTVETAIDGWPVEFSDTAGLRAGADELEAEGIERARGQLARADVQIIVLDRARPPHADDCALLDERPDAIVAANKSDLADVWGRDLPAAALAVSALTGAGVAALLEMISRGLVPVAPAAGTAVPVIERQVECLRHADRALQSGDREAAARWLKHCLFGESKADLSAHPAQRTLNP
jgi:tRNA modification GTPase